jgi:uncharacterized protein YbaP (TraB family)
MATALILLVIFFAQACKTSQPVLEDTPSYSFENALLWQIDGNGLASPSYVFGTIHMINADKFFWPEGTLTAFDKSDDIVFEIDMDDMFDMGSQMALLSKAFMSDNQKLSDFYSEEDYAFVRKHFDDMGIPLFFLERLKPMFLTVFASGDIELGVGLDQQSSIKSYEMELYTLSQEANKDVQGLETVEYQISVFDSIPYDAQAKMLLETIKAGDTENDAFQALIQMYLDQDINNMVTAIGEDEGGISGYEDILLYSRNKNWIPIMAEKMKKATVFFAVGAGHLGGKDGVLDLLQKAGYKLTPLSHKKAI